MVWERAGRLAGLAGGRSGSPLAHSVGTCLHWASPGFSVGVGLIRGQKFSAASLGAREVHVAGAPHGARRGFEAG